VASAVSAVPGHVPAVTGEVAASPGRAPAGRLVKTVRVSALMTVLGAACLIGGCAAGGAQTDSVAVLLAHGGRGPGDGDGREHGPHGRALRQGR
jgi:hypothetical protein